MEKSKLYAVAMLFSKKTDSTELNLATSLRIVVAIDEDAAFGYAYPEGKKKYPDHVLEYHIVVEVSQDVINQQADG